MSSRVEGGPHVLAVGDRRTFLARGKALGEHTKGGIAMAELQNLMAGEKELQAVSAELRGTV